MGATVGFFFFLHLGFPSQPELSGYLSGLFVAAGCKVGLLGWFVRIVIRRLSQRSRPRKCGASDAARAPISSNPVSGHNHVMPAYFERVSNHSWFWCTLGAP